MLMASLSTCHLCLWLGWQSCSILLNPLLINYKPYKVNHLGKLFHQHNITSLFKNKAVKEMYLGKQYIKM